MNPELIGKEQGEGHKKRKMPFSPSLSTLTTEPTSGTRSTRRAKKAGNTRRTYITDASLLPNGGMHGRLFDAAKHLPVDCDHKTIDSEGLEKRKQPKCSLHTWFGGQYRTKVLYCIACKLNLCVHCYKLFHSETNLVAMKDDLKKKFDSNKKKK